MAFIINLHFCLFNGKFALFFVLYVHIFILLLFRFIFFALFIVLYCISMIFNVIVVYLTKVKNCRKLVFHSRITSQLIALRKSSGYSQSASLLAHNRMLLRSLSGVACTTPDTSKSQPTAYCSAQLKQGTCLIRLNQYGYYTTRFL